MATTEPRFQILVEKAIDIIYTTDEYGRIIFINSSVKKYFNIKPNEIKGKFIIDFFRILPLVNRKEQLKSIIKCFVDAINKKKDEFTHTIHLNDGTDKYFQINSRLIWDPQKKYPLGSEGIIHDITTIHLLQEQLANSEKKYRNIIENVRDAVIVVGLDGKFKFVSPQLSQILGGIEIGPDLQSIMPLIHKDDVNYLFKNFQEAAKAETVLYNEGIEFRALHRDGRYIWLGASTKNYFDENGKLAGFITTLRDITKRKQIEVALQQNETALRERIKELRCLYEISRLFETSNISLDALFYGILKQIPPAWQFSDKVCARIKYGEREYKTSNFKETSWKLSVSLEVRKQDITIEVFYIEDLPFFIEEINLLKEIGLRLKHHLEQKIAKEELKRFKTISDNANYGMAISDLQGNLIYINDYFAKVHGYTPDELIGKNLAIFHNEEQMEHVLELNRKLLEVGCYNATEVWHKHKNGSIFPMLMNGIKIATENGEPLYMAATAIDISEQKKAEQKLRESEEKYRLIAQNANDLIAILDEKMTYEFVNNAYLKILGYSSAELIGKPAIMIVHPDDQKSAIKHLLNGFRKGEAQMQLRVKRKDGKYVWIEIVGRIFSDNNGKKKGLIIGRNITKRRELLEKIQKRNEELKELDHLKDDLFADISHELRTPLVAIKGFSELLLRSSNLDEIQRHDIEIILRNEDRLERLIHEMLDYSRLKSGKIFFKRDKIRVSKILQELKQELAPLIQEKQLIIEEYLNPDDELILDKHQITKVIRNLLTNAIKFSFPTGKITIKSNIHKGIWAFSVKDNGIGIPKNEIPHIFSRFVRLKNADMLQSTGIGLGLTICKKIIEAYNGKIWVESGGLNKGATFHFQLKLNG
ncbi:MAG: PAS domain S-box protein [Candidatus Helarchaeota archaeon]